MGDYLTDEEKKMPIKMQLLQYVLGIQSCKTKGDVVELLEEIRTQAKLEGEKDFAKRMIDRINVKYDGMNTEIVKIIEEELKGG